MKGVTKKQGKKGGKTVAIIAGIHGNERVGIDALRLARVSIEPKSGTIYFIEGNLPAIEKNVRLISKNLNRCFVQSNSGTTPEDIRARELMPLLDTCDAVIDLHASNSHKTTPFVICESSGFPIAQLLDFEIISSGWDLLEPGGTDGYMNQIGKIGITLECGSVHNPNTTLPLTRQSILTFLRYFNMIEGEDAPTPLTQRHIRVYAVVHKTSDQLSFAREYADFELLTEGEMFAQEGKKKHIASAGDCIIFPRPNAAIGAESYLLGRIIT